MKPILSVKLLAGILICLITVSCSSDKKPDAQQIVDRAIEVHGGEKFNELVVSFRLRDKQYRALRDNGAFVYSRSFTDSTGNQIYDVLRNSGFERQKNDTVIAITQEKAIAYSASVNSVVYFALLPYFLNDAAVVKEYAGEASIKGEPYYKVKVTFKQEGGGEGHEDIYIYWFHQLNNTMDYLAYSFKEDGGGTRFREAVNAHEIGGIRFQDYLNYTSEEPIQLENYDKAFEAGTLKKISAINLEEIVVKPLK